MDARPLTGEPLALDLLNTEWIDGGERHDLLAQPGGVAAWGHPRRRSGGAGHRARRDPRGTGRPSWTMSTRCWRVARSPSASGRTGPERIIRVDEERWRLPWLAAQNLVELLRAHPDRIRQCANHECVLWFYDHSRSGQRQWCSMASCGNRAKARRHYARTRSAEAS